MFGTSRPLSSSARLRQLMTGAERRMVVSHLTRMGGAGTVCIAGVDPDTRAHLRPVLPFKEGQLTTASLAGRGGVFGLGNVINLGRVIPKGRRPHVEDCEFSLRRARLLGALAPAQFWDLLLKLARPSLAAIFGPELVLHGSSRVVAPGKGSASLGCLLPCAPPVLSVNAREGRKRIRISLYDAFTRSDLSVTDLRLYDLNTYEPLAPRVAALAERIRRGVKVILGVGLTRLYKKREGDAELHWLQVNNVHLEDDPLWRSW